ncbi:MAG: type I-U CRISPR-associated protein Cas8c [Rhodospirillales bacterium]|nr:type I-U CRISPR-associated protein Cas8c [Rhodospirillales bacterium]
MGEAIIPVDLRNPGQVFACLGFLEAADVLCGPAEGGFDWTGDERFILRAEGAENPVEVVLEFLKEADVKWLSPCGALQERDGGSTVVVTNVASSPEPKPADLPAVLVGSNAQQICFGFWADGSSRFNTTFKKSTYGSSSHIRFRNAVDGICGLDPHLSVVDPLNQAVKTKSLFRLDPRGSADPIDAGTSPDKLRKGGIEVRVATYPICEALAVLGLEYARPHRVDSQRLRYSVWSSLISCHCGDSVLLSPTLSRAAMAGQFAFLRMRHFSVSHEEVKKGGDRRITNITEELHID